MPELHAENHLTIVDYLCDFNIMVMLFNLQVCVCSVSIPEVVWNQRTSTNSIPGTLQGQSDKGI